MSQPVPSHGWAVPSSRHSGAPDGRETWIDVARGIAILLVVINHTRYELFLAGAGSHVWGLFAETMAAVRMPLFFLLSGLFVAKALRLPRREFTRRKILSFLWPYVLWCALYVPIVAASAGIGRDSPAAAIGRWIWSALTVHAALWYLVALPLFYAVARLTERAPRTVRLVVAASLSVLFGLEILHTGLWGPDHMAQYYVYFLVGQLFGTAIRRNAPTADLRTLARLLVATAFVAAALILLPEVRTVLWHTVGPAVAVPPAVICAARLRGPLVRPLARIGRSTLPVYVLHMSVLLLVVPLLAPAAGSLTWLIVPLLAAAAAVVSLRLGRVLGTWAPWTLALPGGAGRPAEAEAGPRVADRVVGSGR